MRHPTLSISKLLLLLAIASPAIADASPTTAHSLPESRPESRPENRPEYDTASSKTPTLRVLSYNINGLPEPLKTGKMPHYERIAEILRERRQSGTQPHVVLLQEAFDKRTRLIAETTGYRYIFKGPDRKARSRRGRAHWTPATRKGYSQFSDPQKITGSGLYILSDYPLMDAHFRAFDSDACAGFDCLSNKAILFARLAMPGVSEPIDLINSHFNSHAAAGTPGSVAFVAFEKQSSVLVSFLERLHRGAPIIVAGDFNTKDSRRYAAFRQLVPLHDVAETCLGYAPDCGLGESATKDTVLYDTNDKHFMRGSGRVSLDPVWISRNFDEQLGDNPLSDHLGYEVHYRVTERAGEQIAAR